MHPLLVDGSVVVDEAQDLGLVLHQHLQELGLEVVQAGGQRGVNAMFGLVGGGRWAMGVSKGVEGEGHRWGRASEFSLDRGSERRGARKKHTKDIDNM